MPSCFSDVKTRQSSGVGCLWLIVTLTFFVTGSCTSLLHSGNSASSLQISISALLLSKFFGNPLTFGTHQVIFPNILISCSSVACGYSCLSSILVPEGCPEGGGGGGRSSERQLYSQASHSEDENFHAFD